MVSHLQRISKHTFAVVTWDEEWKSFNNFYIITSADSTVLIDTGKTRHKKVLASALSTLGKKPKEVDTILYTHGHRDHIGGSGLFPQRRNYIHTKDFCLVPKRAGSRFIQGFPDTGQLGISWNLLGFHTPGSTLFYYPKDRVLFCGDHVSFFGERISKNGVVCSGQKLRAGLIDYFAKWANTQKKENFESVQKFRKGIQTMMSLDARFLCTGHGPVLDGGMKKLFQQLLSAVSR